MGEDTKLGRPSAFNQVIAEAICSRLSGGESLRKICLSDDMPSQTTVYNWLNANEAFVEQYVRAREAQADTLFDEMIDIADDGSKDAVGEDGAIDHEHIQRSKLRIETRKWMAGKLRPKKYGDKTLIGSDPDNPLPEGFAVNLVRTAADTE